MTDLDSEHEPGGEVSTTDADYSDAASDPDSEFGDYEFLRALGVTNNRKATMGKKSKGGTTTSNQATTATTSLPMFTEENSNKTTGNDNSDGILGQCPNFDSNIPITAKIVSATQGQTVNTHAPLRVSFPPLGAHGTPLPAPVSRGDQKRRAKEAIFGINNLKLTRKATFRRQKMGRNKRAGGATIYSSDSDTERVKYHTMTAEQIQSDLRQAYIIMALIIMDPRKMDKLPTAYQQKIFSKMADNSINLGDNITTVATKLQELVGELPETLKVSMKVLNRAVLIRYKDNIETRRTALGTGERVSPFTRVRARFGGTLIAFEDEDQLYDFVDQLDQGHSRKGYKPKGNYEGRKAKSSSSSSSSSRSGSRRRGTPKEGERLVGGHSPARSVGQGRLRRGSTTSRISQKEGGFEVAFQGNLPSTAFVEVDPQGNSNLWRTPSNTSLVATGTPGNSGLPVTTLADFTLANGSIAFTPEQWEEMINHVANSCVGNGASGPTTARDNIRAYAKEVKQRQWIDGRKASESCKSVSSIEPGAGTARPGEGSLLSQAAQATRAVAPIQVSKGGSISGNNSATMGTLQPASGAEHPHTMGHTDTPTGGSTASTPAPSARGHETEGRTTTADQLVPAPSTIPEKSPLSPPAKALQLETNQIPWNNVKDKWYFIKTDQEGGMVRGDKLPGNRPTFIEEARRFQRSGNLMSLRGITQLPFSTGEGKLDQQKAMPGTWYLNAKLDQYRRLEKVPTQSEQHNWHFIQDYQLDEAAWQVKYHRPRGSRDVPLFVEQFLCAQHENLLVSLLSGELSKAAWDNGYHTTEILKHSYVNHRTLPVIVAWMRGIDRTKFKTCDELTAYFSEFLHDVRRCLSSCIAV
eukprot:GHVU01195968.1.p1 GENE.GHVU01195968.1~~GHVU01195968.1.p1  ORF type:complete len:971 (-),score=70.82 GHVU01195968.1:8-2602(-)